MGGLAEEQVDRTDELARVAKPGFEHPDFRLFPPSAEAVRQVGEPAAAPGPLPSLPCAQGTHMLKAADRSSLVTVILQELPPVETQDQRCRAKRTRVEGSKRGALAAATPGTRAAVRTGSSQGLPIPAPAVATAGTQAWGAGAQAPSRRAAWAHPIPASAVAIGMGRGGPHPEAARLSVEETLRGKCLIFLPQEIQRPSGLNSSDRPQPLIGHSQSRWVGGTHTTAPPALIWELCQTT